MKYYIFVNNQQIGPMTMQQLRYYNVNTDTKVRDENTADWKALLYYPELMQVYGPNATVNVAAEEPQRIVVTPTPAEPLYCYPQRKKDSNSWIIWLIAVMVGLPIIGVALYFLFILLMVIMAS